ncbi:MAG: DUF6064 family protein [Burkholderiaceae bacterium]
MFAPRTYWRQFELQNAEWWPVHLLAWAGTVLWIAIGVRMPGRDRGLLIRVAAVGLAALWAFVAFTFMLGRYAPINWAAPGFAVAFGLGAAGLALLAMRPDLGRTSIDHHRLVAALLLAVALAGYPLAAPMSGRPWSQAELFGLAPDPTAVGTLGILIFICANGAVSAWLLRGLRGLAAAWCLVSMATLATMGAGEAWVLGTVLLVVLALFWQSARKRPGRQRRER